MNYSENGDPFPKQQKMEKRYTLFWNLDRVEEEIRSGQG